VLLSAIDKDMFDKLNIGKIFLEKLGGMFGNMLGVGEADYDSAPSERQDDYSHKNVMFEQQSKIGRAKGEMRSPEPIRKQIKKFYDLKKNMRSGQSTVVMENFDEEDTLG